MDSPALERLPEELLPGRGKVTIQFGSFRDQLELGGYARHAQKNWRQRHLKQ
jgi:hypothetical protein